MNVSWEYFFPDIIFLHDRFETWSKDDLKKITDKDGFWDPQKDFEFHLHTLKVDPKYFIEKNFRLFPKDFTKHLYSIELFEEARVELLNRLKITKVPFGDSLVGCDEEGNEYVSFRILLDAVYKSVEVDGGTIGNMDNKYQINTTRNIINSHRFNSINILYDWLLSLNPRGSYNNNWQIFAYGLTEYDETLSYVDTFIVEDQNEQTSIPGFDNENNNKIISHAFSSNSDRDISPSTSTSNDIRKLLKEWNPFI